MATSPTRGIEQCLIGIEEQVMKRLTDARKAEKRKKQAERQKEKEENQRKKVNEQIERDQRYDGLRKVAQKELQEVHLFWKQNLLSHGSI
jgi:hypothetical protein